MTNLSRKFSDSADNEYQSMRPEGPSISLTVPSFGSLPPCATRRRQLKVGAPLKAPPYSAASAANAGLFSVRATPRFLSSSHMLRVMRCSKPWRSRVTSTTKIIGRPGVLCLVNLEIPPSEDHLFGSLIESSQIPADSRSRYVIGLSY